jgi:hypothetical protein
MKSRNSFFEGLIVFMESEGIVDAISGPVKIILEENNPAACFKICYTENRIDLFFERIRMIFRRCRTNTNRCKDSNPL